MNKPREILEYLSFLVAFFLVIALVVWRGV